MSDVTRSTMPADKPGMTFKDHAKELLARFPGVDHGDLLLAVTAEYLMAFKYGNKREERAACDYLNGLQEIAVRMIDAKKEVAAVAEEKNAAQRQRRRNTKEANL